ncbi:LPXTG cell wall anchor domain-containing protein [Streptococcus sp. VTCC 12905]|uniref:LPXTG cell wall anchor domain-containing protein n=1 Tax=Streptococcus sp. VTCC 12905 TaxID=3413768 RepID=UPI003D9C79C8
MKKWTKMMTLYSVAVLASASSLTAFADENVPATDTRAVAVESTIANSTATPSDDTTTPTVPTDPAETPTVPSDTTGGAVVTPTDPNATVPTEPSTTEPADTTTVTQPSDTTVPSTDGTANTPTEPSTTTEPSEPAQPTEPTTTNTTPSDGDGTGTVTVPTVNGGTTTLTPNPAIPTNNPNVSAQTAVNAGASQVGTTSTVTGQVVSNVSPSAPVYTNTGYQIVSTQNSQVVVAYNDGTTATVAPEVVGGVVNADKTISVKTNTGETKTLPTTGEKENAMLTISGIITMLGAFLFKKKMVKDN